MTNKAPKGASHPAALLQQVVGDIDRVDNAGKALPDPGAHNVTQRAIRSDRYATAQLARYCNAQIHLHRSYSSHSH